VPTIALSLLVLLLTASSAEAAAWRRPVDGEPLRAFSLGSDPYARGRHRGVDLGAKPGALVRSACQGRVTFAGRVPRGGRTVSVRCGPLVASYQLLAAIAVRRGQRVAAGAKLGAVGGSGDRYEPRPHLHLGARVAATGSYVDPLTLLRDTLLAPPVVPAARVRPPGPPARAPVPRLRRPDPHPRLPAPLVPRALPLAIGPSFSHPPLRPAMPSPRSTLPSRPTSGAPHRSPAAPATRPRYPAIPWTVWVGLGSITAALRIGGLVRGRRRRRAVAPATRTA